MSRSDFVIPRIAIVSRRMLGLHKSRVNEREKFLRLKKKGNRLFFIRARFRIE
jgi:hypothetical protein